MQAEAERLREPVGVAREGAEQHAADDDVVEMRDQEQAVVQQEIRGRHRDQHAGEPPMMKVTMKPIDHIIGVVKRMRPANIVNSQL